MQSKISERFQNFAIPGLCDHLSAGFPVTNLVELIKSIDDLYRYRFIEDPELLSLKLTDQIQLLAEKRSAQMEWLYCISLTLEIENSTLIGMVSKWFYF